MLNITSGPRPTGCASGEAVRCGMTGVTTACTAISRPGGIPAVPASGQLRKGWVVIPVSGGVSLESSVDAIEYQGRYPGGRQKVTWWERL